VDLVTNVTDKMEVLVPKIRRGHKVQLALIRLTSGERYPDPLPE